MRSTLDCQGRPSAVDLARAISWHAIRWRAISWLTRQVRLRGPLNHVCIDKPLYQWNGLHSFIWSVFYTGLGICSSDFRSNGSFFVIEILIRSWKDWIFYINLFKDGWDWFAHSQSFQRSTQSICSRSLFLKEWRERFDFLSVKSHRNVFHSHQQPSESLSKNEWFAHLGVKHFFTPIRVRA